MSSSTGMDRPPPLRERNLYALPWQLAEPDRLRYFQRDGAGRRHRAHPEFLLVFRVPTVGTYESQVSRIAALAWTLLPLEWQNSSKLQLRFSYHRQNPRLELDAGDELVIFSSNNIGSDQNPEFVFSASEIANRTYDFHESTQKYNEVGFQFQWRRNNSDIQKIHSRQDLFRAAMAHVADRVVIQEHYESAYLRHLNSDQADAADAQNGSCAQTTSISPFSG